MAQGASRGFEANSFEIKMLSERGRRRGSADGLSLQSSRSFLRGASLPTAVRSGSRPGPNAMTVAEWLESPYLQRVASRVGYQYGVPSQEIRNFFKSCA